MSEPFGIVVDGATGGIATRQHLANALVPIIHEGGLQVGERRVVPELLLVGRDAGRLQQVAERFGLDRWTTDVEAALADEDFGVFFDAGFTGLRTGLLRAAILAGKHVYSEKPVVTSVEDGQTLAAMAAARGAKFGVVEDKIHLPGFTKLRLVAESGFFGKVIGFRLDFGYWIRSDPDGLLPRPSWNYKMAEGGGLLLDMYPHWRYVLEGVLGPIHRVVTAAWTALPQRIDEEGKPYTVDVEDSTATLVELENGAFGVVTSSWATRVKRDDLIVLQVDGTEGSAVAGVHRCKIQSLAATPWLHIDTNVDLGRDYHADWWTAPFTPPFSNGYRMGWEAFIRHVVADEPLHADLAAGIRDVALAQACQASVAERGWTAISRFV